jgi:deoxyribodipyrimidine photo-lyase
MVLRCGGLGGLLRNSKAYCVGTARCFCGILRSMDKYLASIFLFRRDLRLEDNTGLHHALRESARVWPVFVFDPTQCDPQQNAYFSNKAFGFLLDSLEELDEALRKRGSRLYTYAGTSDAVLEMLLQESAVDAVYANSDYTPFARRRDEKLERVCKQAGVAWRAHEDYALSPVKEVATQQGKPYSVFTPFYRNASQYVVAETLANKGDFLTRAGVASTVSIAHMRTYAGQGALRGGRTEALALLRDGDVFRAYETRRNDLAEDATSHLSPHHKFGTISIRETYRAAKKHADSNAEPFIRELYWRDFAYHIAWHFPQVFGKSFLAWGDRVAWRNDAATLARWKAGETGVPIVDAAMRELNETGFMHNRARMVVASFLTKNLLVDWREGEQYFAQKLIDYDPSVNNASWQWSASVGADPRPLRIFNPYTQAQKYDAHAAYIKRHVPELRDVDATLLTDGKERDFSLLAPQYPAPMVSQVESYHRAQDAYRAAKG